MISKEEVMEWKYHPVTVEFFDALKSRIAGLTEELVAGAHESEPRLLAWKAGAIQAMQDILETDL